MGIEQLLRADKEVFTLMAQELSGSLKARLDGTLPIDEKLKALVYDPRITQHLLPLPKGQSRAADAASSSGDKEEDPIRKVPKPKKKAKASPKAKAKCLRFAGRSIWGDARIQSAMVDAKRALTYVSSAIDLTMA